MVPVIEMFTNLNGMAEGRHLTKSLLIKIRHLSLLFLVLMFTVTVLPFWMEAKAETRIISLTPPSGPVGTTVLLSGNISTENGLYVVQFDEINVTSGKAKGYEVNASFDVATTFAGYHNVILIDLTEEENATTTFQVSTSYSLETDMPEPPAQRQEGDNVHISINITGGEKNETFTANITVQASTNNSYTNLVDIPISNIGNGNATTIYPTDFAAASTNFTGEYKVFLNETLASGIFSIGLTDSTEYHRFQIVDVKATGYAQNENVTITVSFEEDVVHSKNVTAEEGMIRYTNWTIPSDASMGTYTLNITSISPNATFKNPTDTQNFSVPGFAINITTKNLAKEPVPSVTVEVSENAIHIANATSDLDGLATVMLEIGNYTSKAKFREKDVGECWINVTGAMSLDFICDITNLRVLIMDEAGVRIPEVKIYVTSVNQTLSTDINGMAVAHSLLPNITYVLNASRYGKQFNVTTISRLLVNGAAVAWFTINITCPTLTLKVDVADAKGQPLVNAVVKVHELMGGLYYEQNTTSEGVAVFDSTFGRFDVEIYARGVKLNETEVDLFQDQNLSILCKLYDLTVSIKVADYFGQLISNANVTLQREGLPSRSSQTQSDGKATFTNLIGGSLRIAVYLNDQMQPCVSKTFSVDESTTIEIKIQKFVLLAGILVETSQLTTALTIIVTIMLILLLEIYRRKKS